MANAKTSLTAIFIDDGGVLNDNSRRAPEWVRLIAEFMPPRMGGTGNQWAEANREVFPPLWKRIVARMSEFSSHREFMHFYATNWFADACTHVGVQTPPDDEALRLYKEFAVYVAERADCDFEGAADAVCTLKASGHTLYMASGTPSWELEGILNKMGIKDAFTTLYGPDLIDHVKYGPAFYEKLFADSGVSPEQAMVVDSDEECCDWASAAGANTVWIDPSSKGDELSLEELARKLS